jgi:hypothetical protein
MDCSKFKVGQVHYVNLLIYRDNYVNFQITVICTLMVIISIFGQNHTIPVEVPKANHLAHHRHENETVNGTLTFDYTGLTAKTFRDNLYCKYTFCHLSAITG